MSDTRIELIYNLIIEGKPLTKSTLLKSGFTETEINELLKERIIVPTKTNEYRLYCLYELYEYGIKLSTKNEKSKTNNCFLRCYQLDPNNRDFALRLFLHALKLGDYKLAFERFSAMEKIESEKYQNSNNLYLYLLSIITSCTEEYEERLSNIDYDSVLLPQDSNEYNKEQMNNIGHSVMKNKYEYALELINTIMAKEQVRLVSNEVLKELLIQVLNQEYKFFSNILSFVNNRRYHVIISFLEVKKQKRYLSNKETYIYMLSKSLEEITKTRTIPEVTINQTKNLYEAIKGNNFIVARRINSKMLKHEKRNLENQIIDTLLKEIGQLIYNLQNEQLIIEATSQVNSIETEELANYLQTENISFEEARQRYNLTEEQILLIKLIYARNYYIEEMYLLGDCLLKEVEGSKNKTSKVIKLLNEIRTNKKFYKNRRETYAKRKILRQA